VKAGPLAFEIATLELLAWGVWQAVKKIRQSKAIVDFMNVSRLGNIETSNCKYLINWMIDKVGGAPFTLLFILGRSEQKLYPQLRARI
jgi:hypothetical protein